MGYERLDPPELRRVLAGVLQPIRGGQGRGIGRSGVAEAPSAFRRLGDVGCAYGLDAHSGEDRGDD